MIRKCPERRKDQRMDKRANGKTDRRMEGRKKPVLQHPSGHHRGSKIKICHTRAKFRITKEIFQYEDLPHELFLTTR